MLKWKEKEYQKNAYSPGKKYRLIAELEMGPSPGMLNLKLSCSGRESTMSWICTVVRYGHGHKERSQSSQSHKQMMEQVKETIFKGIS